MDIDTTDLTSYIPGYDDYCENDYTVSFEEYNDMKNSLQDEIEKQDYVIEDLKDNFNYIKEKIEEIKDKNYKATEEDIKYIEDIISEIEL